jgi:hypothetical protein
MLKVVAVGVTALFVMVSPPTYAQSASMERQERLTAADMATLTDARVNIVKTALQLTPDQEKYWPAIEDAIRARAKDRQTRIATIEKKVAEVQERSAVEVLRDRNPVDFMRRRADALAQRATDLKKLADAWEPLYQTLNPEQRRRMAQLAIVALLGIRNRIEERRSHDEGDDEGATFD